MKNTLLILLLLAGLSWQAFAQTPAKGIEGTWNGTLDAGSAKLRLVVTVTKSEAGVYTGSFESVDQGATIPFDTVTLKGDAVTFESKAAGIVYEAVLNKESTELVGTFKQGGQEIPLTLSKTAQRASPATGFEGTWNGVLDAGGTKLRLIVTVTRSEAGAYAGKFESVDQGATVPFDTVTLKGDDAAFESKAAGIVYDAKLDKARTELVGTFKQGGQEIPLMLTRGGPAAAPKAAPKPKPDYSAPADAPYTTEEVLVKTPGGFTLAGTLTLPKGASKAKPVGAIVTITGSGQENRDSEIGLEGYKPFRQLADSFARSGIASLRMDDRGMDGSGGIFKGSTSEDFGEDARAGLAYLRTRPEIRADRLGVVGHSEGAVIAPMVASKEPTLRAIVLLAGIAEPGRPTLHFQMKNLIEHNAKLTAAEKEAQIAEIPKKIDAMMAADPWMKFFLTYEPASAMRKVKTPVLILTGSNDQQAVPAQVALQEAAFKTAGNKDVTAQVLPGLNHLFVEDSDGFPGNYAKLPPPVMMRSDVVKMVTIWLVKRLK
ncbi:MAG: alpha/beta hydrolase [Chloracidobacterium sp.]|nr:alpha/beta hydrolase [Chloracidobacterium sp.]